MKNEEVNEKQYEDLFLLKFIFMTYMNFPISLLRRSSRNGVPELQICQENSMPKVYVPSNSRTYW